MTRCANLRAKVFIVLLAMVACITPAFAVQPDEILPDAALETRARQISGGLRCLVCQNQSIDDSDAPLARDLRLLVRERLKAGDSDDQVRAFLVQRYGEFVLLKPPLSATTLLLWAAPFLLLLGGIVLVLRTVFRRPPSLPGAPNLSPEERAALDRLMGQDGDRRS
jgi:cytochrome c-type biogenesis protein CcmH